MERLSEVHSEAGLYAQHREGLVRFAGVLVGPSDAPDAVSDAMVSLLRSDSLQEAENPRALMYRAVFAKAKSLQRSGFRRRQRERRIAERVAVEDPELGVDVVRAVAGLSPQQRACVFLTYWEDLTAADVAERLDIGEGAVKKHLARARSKLREVLDD